MESLWKNSWFQVAFLAWIVSGALLSTDYGPIAIDAMRDLASKSEVPSKQGLPNPPIRALQPPPTLLDPLNGATFNYFPRALDFHWLPVVGATTYAIEFQYKWTANMNWQPLSVYGNLKSITFKEEWVGAQPGRWRVWANFPDGSQSAKSEWRTFNFLQ